MLFASDAKDATIAQLEGEAVALRAKLKDCIEKDELRLALISKLRQDAAAGQDRIARAEAETRNSQEEVTKLKAALEAAARKSEQLALQHDAVEAKGAEALRLISEGKDALIGRLVDQMKEESRLLHEATRTAAEKDALIERLSNEMGGLHAAADHELDVAINQVALRDEWISHQSMQVSGGSRGPTPAAGLTLSACILCRRPQCAMLRPEACVGGVH